MTLPSVRLALLASLLAPAALLAQTAAPPVKAPPAIKWDEMDLGPFHSGTFKIGGQVTAKGIAIKVGAPGDEATVLFDTELLRVSAAWTGSFLRFPRQRGGLEGQIDAGEGKVAFRTAYAPGWALGGEIANDPRERHQGSLPADVAKWRGLYLHGGKVLLSYTVGATPVLELPGSEERAGARVFTRTIQLGKTTATHSLLIADMAGAAGSAEGSAAVLTAPGETDPATAAAMVIDGAHLPPGAKFRTAANGRVVLDLPKLAAPATFQVVIWTGAKAAMPQTADLLKPAPLPDLTALTKGGAPQWGAAVETKGVPGTADEAYVADEITLPEDNRWKSWLRPGGHDFFPDGTAALASLSGDVFVVSGLDEQLARVQWRRFATGLFQPLGVKVVEGKIHVIGRDQITRLHDLNADGEADFYECFNNDCVVTENYHEFALDLQTDAAGNFYYAKGSPWQPTCTSPHQGCLMKVSKDGQKMEIFATGFRAPNGLGIGPKDELSVSDNEGHWMPANRLNLVRPSGFYGMVTAAHRALTFKAADGSTFKANPSDPKDQAAYKQTFWGKADSPIPAEGQEPPLVWLPKQIDNSPGGEVWVPPGAKWGPLAGQMLHLSYGKCILYNVLQERVGDAPAQGGVVRFPIKFTSGIQRARFSPKDGQLYLSGLRVWQSDAAKDGCFTRVRYTGKPVTMPIALRAKKGGVEIEFTGPLDEKSATDAENFSVEQWNYAWTGNYGSPEFKVSDPKQKGRDLVLLEKVTLSADKKTLRLAIPDLAPVMQMKVRYKVAAADGKTLDQEIHQTIHRVAD